MAASSDDIAALLQRFSGIITTDPEELITSFASVLRIDRSQGEFFLAAANYNLEVAINLYLDSQARERGAGAEARHGLGFASGIDPQFSPTVYADDGDDAMMTDVYTPAAPATSPSSTAAQAPASTLDYGARSWGGIHAPAYLPSQALHPALGSATALHAASPASAAAHGHGLAFGPGGVAPSLLVAGHTTSALGGLSSMPSHAPAHAPAPATSSILAPSTFAFAPPSFGQSYPSLPVLQPGSHAQSMESSFTGHIPPAANTMDDD